MPTDQHPVHDHCAVCGNEIRQMIFRGTGFCGEACRKKKQQAREVLELEAMLVEVPDEDR